MTTDAQIESLIDQADGVNARINEILRENPAVEEWWNNDALWIRLWLDGKEKRIPREMADLIEIESELWKQIAECRKIDDEKRSLSGAEI